MIYNSFVEISIGLKTNISFLSMRCFYHSKQLHVVTLMKWSIMGHLFPILLFAKIPV